MFVLGNGFCRAKLVLPRSFVSSTRLVKPASVATWRSHEATEPCGIQDIVTGAAWLTSLWSAGPAIAGTGGIISATSG